MEVTTENIYGEPITGELVLERKNTCIVQTNDGERHVVRKEDLGQYGYQIKRTYYDLHKNKEFFDLERVKRRGRPVEE